MPRKPSSPKKKTTRRPAQPSTSETPVPVTVSSAKTIVHAEVPSRAMTDTLPPLKPVVRAEPNLIKPKKKTTSRVWLRVAAIFLVIIGLAAVIYPFWPEIQYKFWPPNESDALASLTVTTAQQAGTNTYTTGTLPITHAAVEGGNKIIIPKINVDMTIVEGTDESSLNKGAWHLPYTSSPDKGGNTVITAHRYLYRPPSTKTFYLLDKLELGDTFQVNWEGLRYNYQVTDIKVVEPTDVYVLNPTSNPEVTLITCTPLFTTKQRLVVVAEEIP